MAFRLLAQGDEPYVLAKSDRRIGKECAGRRRRVKKSWWGAWANCGNRSSAAIRFLLVPAR